MENQAAPAPAAQPPVKTKKRHGCLTVWLILIIIGCALSLVGYLVGSSFMVAANVPGWVIPVYIVISVLQLVCAIALFKWKKWGFWGIIVATVISVIIGFATHMGIATVIFALIGIAILYGVLQIGKENKGWPQLD
jgi:hypothetical protein